LLFHFDPGQLPKKNLLILLDAVLVILPKQADQHKQEKKVFDGPTQEVDLAVEA